jgi:hypothetical protein
MDLVDKRITPSDSSSMGYALALGDGRLAFQMSDSVNNPFLNVGPVGPDLRDGAWHHVAVAVQRAATNGGVLCGWPGRVTSDPTSEQGDLTTTHRC